MYEYLFRGTCSCWPHLEGKSSTAADDTLTHSVLLQPVSSPASLPHVPEEEWQSGAGGSTTLVAPSAASHSATTGTRSLSVHSTASGQYSATGPQRIRPSFQEPEPELATASGGGLQDIRRSRDFESVMTASPLRQPGVGQHAGAGGEGVDVVARSPASRLRWLLTPKKRKPVREGSCKTPRTDGWAKRRWKNGMTPSLVTVVMS